MRVTGGCGMRLRMHSDVGPIPNAGIGRMAGVRGVLVGNMTGSRDISQITVINLPSDPNVTFGIFSHVTGTRVYISVVLRSINHSNAGSVLFAIPATSTSSTITTLGSCYSVVKTGTLRYSASITGMSIINTNVRARRNITTSVFRTLTSTGVGVRVVSSDRVHISILIRGTVTSQTIRTIRHGFFNRWTQQGGQGGGGKISAVTTGGGAGMLYFTGGGKNDNGSASYTGINCTLTRVNGGILLLSNSVRLGLDLSFFPRRRILTVTRKRGGLCRTVHRRRPLASCVIPATCRNVSLVPSSALVDDVRCRLFAG